MRYMVSYRFYCVYWCAWGSLCLGNAGLKYRGYLVFDDCFAYTLTRGDVSDVIFAYAPTDKMQGIVQKIFYFHVSLAITMFFAFFVVFVASIMYLWKSSDWWDAVALSAAEIGVVFCTLVLITGPIWGRPIWGTWWSWDPTLTLTLVLWLIYVAYLMLRIDAHDPKRARFAAILGVVGFVDVPLIRWSVEKWRTLHPKPVLIQEGGTTGIESSAMLLTFVFCLGALLLLFFYLSW